ncbi:ABC transporter permease [Helicobacter cappadocius]|uniref:ABC transporter permease n=1 Tax=Helicobacter cappadocius TaxID=3063998 RepID=A0AA90PKD1_9HELI|nr:MULTISPECIES: ABC transporter permease [unclassified Helicobacter]MDO7253593.1 ABC transporter permease [Helicobacter sp. faydin-H75]MDP2539521.1 ABC transporter permease [Helicobacter sp. faydin-H76]
MPSKTTLIRFLLKRYLRFDKTQPFISITAILAFLGVGVGVMVLIVAMAIMNGMSKEFEKKLFVMNYPLTLFATTSRGISEDVLDQLEEKFPDLIFSPYLRVESVARDNGIMSAGIVFGVDIQKEAKINEILAKALEGIKISDFYQDKFSLIIGEGLKETLMVEKGSKISLFFTKLEPTGLTLSPTMKRFNIKGFFNSGLKAYDTSYLYANISAIAAIKNLPAGVYDGIHIYSKHPMEDIVKIKEFLLNTKNYGIGIEGWWQQNGNFFSAMALEKRVLFIVLMLIILMASLNIISSLLMVVMNRRKEIALLLSLGASSKEIKKTFFWLGNFIGISGIVFGIVLAMFGLYILSTFPIISLPADVYGITKLPIDLSLMDFFSTVIGAIIIVCASSYYPAKKASEVDALSVLRNE